MEKITFMQIYYKMNGFSCHLLAFGVEMGILLLSLSCLIQTFAERLPRPFAVYPVAEQLTETGVTVPSLAIMAALVIEVALKYSRR